MAFDTSLALQTIQALLKKLVVPSDVLTSKKSAEDFQAILAPLESNSDPNNPGLAEIFEQANTDVGAANASLEDDPLNAAAIIAMSQELHDLYQSYTSNQYLLRVSGEIGFPGPAQQFYETVIPNAQQFGTVTPIAVPGGSPPPIIPVPPPGPPGPTPPPPAGPPAPPVAGPPPAPPTTPGIWLAAEQTGLLGSGEPNNGVSLRAVLGVNAVYVPIYAATTDVNSVDCVWIDDSNDPTIVGGNVELWIDAYKAANLAVILVLEVGCLDGTSRADFRPHDPVLFLSALAARTFELAQCAHRKGASALSIAPEVFPYSGNGDNPHQYMPQWTTIANTARGAFSGAVLYQAVPNNAGPLGSPQSMDWAIWDAVGVNIYPSFGSNTTAASIKHYWETTIDTEGTAGYNQPLFGPSSWLRFLYNDWKIHGKKVWLYSGVQMTVGSPLPVPAPPPTPSPVPIPTPPPITPPPPAPTPSPPATFREVVDWSYASDAIWNVGVGTLAAWGASSDIDVAQLRQLTGAINAATGGQPVFVGESTDPVVTVHCSDTLYPVADQQLHVPRTATPTNGYINLMDDTQRNRRWSFAGCTFTNGSDASGGLTATTGAVFDALGNGITDLQGRLNNYDFGIGAINIYDIGQGAIRHAVRFGLSQDAVLRPTTWNQGIAWPNPHADVDITGYSGHIQFGVTVGIPDTLDVTTLGLTQGGLMLARALQRYGAIMRATGGSNQISFYADPSLESTATIAQMRSDLDKLIPRLTIMRNQSPTTVNGGGSSIAPTPLPIDPSIPAPPAPPPAPPPAVITLTGITLSNTQFIGGSPDSTVVGAISVQTTGGSFAGTLATTSSSFRVIGSSLDTSGVVPGGTYTVPITATAMAGATGSPLTRTFAITGITASGSDVIINMNNVIGTTSPYVWGAGTEGLGDPGVNTFYAAVNSGWQATYRQENWRLFRFNTEGTFNDWITNSTARSNWFAGSAQFWDNTNNRLVFTLGSSNNTVSPAQAQQVANFFKSKNQECFYWEYYNEPDGMNVNTYCQQFNAIKAALKQVNPNYKVGGPTTSYARGDWNGPFSQQCSPDFVSYHAYFTGSYSNNSSLFSQTLSRVASDVASVRQYFSSSVPIFLGEWNIDYNGNEQMMQGIDGAVFGSLYTYGSMAAANANVTMGAIWTIGQNNNFTFVSNDGSNIRPMGYFLGKAGRMMGGNNVQVSVSSSLPNLKVMANTNGNRWVVWLTNYSTSTAYTINLQGLSGSTYNYWELSPAHTTPTTTGNSISSLAALAIPARSIVFVSNF